MSYSSKANGVNVLKKLLRNIIKNKKIRVRLMIYFVLLIYLPIMLYVYFIYTHTLDAVKTEKIEASKHVLKKTRETLELNISDVSQIVNDFSNNLATGASIEKYYTVTEKYQKSIDNHLKNKLDTIVRDNYYIDDAFLITKDNRIYSTNAFLNVDEKTFFQSSLYNRISTIKEDEKWINLNSANEIFDNLEPNELFLINKIYHIKPLNTEKMSSVNVVKSDVYDVVGHIVAYVNKEKIKEIYTQVALTEDNNIVVYDENYEPIIYNSYVKIPADFLGLYEDSNKDLLMKETSIEDNEFAYGLSVVKPNNWYIASILPIESLMGPTNKAIMDSFWLIVFISIIVSIVIIFQILKLSRLITEKEMVDYRLNLSEDVNEKLRMYKHDFMNHLQIIHSLVEMGHNDRTLKYLRNIVKEGREIHNNYEIGIPELEATINSAIKECKSKGIDVIVEAVEINEKISIDLYDLIKIISNLIKNAIYALDNSIDRTKILKITISYELENYIFEVSNNTPLIEEEMRGKIFNKGFSTKGNKGNGFGLFIVKKLVGKYNGEVKLIVDDSGNRFIVTIPDINYESY